MKKNSLFLKILLISLYCSILQAQEVPVINGPYKALMDEIVFPFFEALKNGDVSSIKRYVAGDMYERKKVLLEQNQEYPEFLRNYYQGVEFYVQKASESGRYLIVDIEIEYPSGDYGSGKLYLQQINDITSGINKTEIWRIIDFSYR